MANEALSMFYGCANRLDHLAEKAIMAYLCWKADDETLTVAESQGKIAERLGVTQPSVARNMGVLESKGWVMVLSRNLGPSPNVVQVNVAPGLRPR